jgi:hypothetical protein
MRSARFLFLTGFIVFFLTLILPVPATSSAQEMSAQEKRQMEMMMKYGTPGKNHELLKKFVGDWDIEIMAWSKPGAAPTKGKGSEKNELLFDGRFIKCQFEGMMMGMKYMGLEIIGYDLYQNKYATIWIDNMSTGFVQTSGMLDSSGKVLTEIGEWPDPMTEGKKMQKVKNVTTFMEDGKFKFEMFMVMPDGTEFRSMELLATRKT